MNKKLLFYLFWLTMLVLGPIAVLENTKLGLVFGNKIILTNFIQRLLGTMAFGALAFQITLGSNMDYFRKILGSSVLKIHIANGLFTYSLVFLHPLMWVVINYIDRGRIDPYFPFVDVCLLCQSWNDWIYNFGRLAFWFLTIGVTAGLLRKYNKFMISHWRKFHILNYFAFGFVAVHSINIGSDVRSSIFLTLYIAGILLVLFSFLSNIKRIISNYRNL